MGTWTGDRKETRKLYTSLSTQSLKQQHGGRSSNHRSDSQADKSLYSSLPRCYPTLLHDGVQLLVEVLSLLIQRIQLQQTLAEQPRLTQLAQLVVRVGDVIYTLVGGNHRQWELQSLRDPSSYLQRFLLIFPTRIYPCFEQGRMRSWMPPTGEFSACFLAFGVGISFSISRRYSSFAFYSHGYHHPRLLEWPQWLPFRLGCLFHRFRTSFSDSLYWGNGRKYNENGSQMNIETN